MKRDPSIYNHYRNLVNAIRSDHAGDVVMVAGHSDRLLPIANLFGSHFQTDLHVNDYDSLWVITEGVSGGSSVKYSLNLAYVTAKKFRWKPWHGIVLPSANKRFDKTTTTIDPLPSLAPNWHNTTGRPLHKPVTRYFNTKSKHTIYTMMAATKTQGENDGIYAACIDATRIAGGYNLRCEVSGVSAIALPLDFRLSV